nr:uncharacterized protein CFP56_17489 [Quercus suber]
MVINLFNEWKEAYLKRDDFPTEAERYRMNLTLQRNFFLVRRPWTVKGEHLVLKRFNPDISVPEVDFSFTEFWIQIHGLPLNRRSRENVLKIGSMAGRALDTDLVGPGSVVWSRNVRVRVEIDVSCPLVPGFPLERDQLPDLWIPFKFEKLRNFCYGCGRLGHDQCDCPDKEVISGFYGKWLKADNDEFRLGINLENLLNPNRLEMEATTSDLQSLVPNNRSN